VEQIVVGMADCRVGDSCGQELVTFALGSCIALAVYDPVAQVGGLVHFMLPDSALDPQRSRANPAMFADTAIPELLDQIAKLGGLKRRLVAHAAGGASMLGEDRTFEIGRRNYEALRRELANAGVALHREAVGGAVSRNLRLEIGTGRICLWESGKRKDAAQRENSSPDRR